MTAARVFLLGLALFAIGCDSEAKDTGPSTAVCAEAERLSTEDCATVNCLTAEDLTCSYGDTSVDGDDCGCHTRLKLFEALCEAGNDDALDTVEAGVVCAP